MNERLAQMQVRAAVLGAMHAGLSRANQAALAQLDAFRVRAAAILKRPVTLAELPALAAQPDDALRGVGIDRHDLNMALKDQRFREAIEREMQALTQELAPLRELIGKCLAEMPERIEQWQPGTEL